DYLWKPEATDDCRSVAPASRRQGPGWQVSQRVCRRVAVLVRKMASPLRAKILRPTCSYAGFRTKAVACASPHSRAAESRLQSDESGRKIRISLGFQSRTSRRRESAATHTAHCQ